MGTVVTGGELQRHLGASLGRNRRWVLAAALVMSVYLVVPMVIVIMSSVTSGQFLQVPPDGFSMRWYHAVLDDPQWADALETSLKVSGSGSVAAVLVATQAVVGLARIGRAGRLLRPLFFLPMVLPYVVFALGLRQASLPLALQHSLWPLIVGQAVVGLPVAFLTISSGMRKIDPMLRRAADSLGASWWRTVWQIELPLLRLSIVLAWLLTFAFCFDEVVLALFLAPPGQSTLPAQLYTEAQQNVSPLIASVSGYIVLLTIALFGLSAVVQRVQRRSRPLRPVSRFRREG